MANGSRGRSGKPRARTLFLSDIHLGFKRARVRELNEFLHGIEAECIVLVGDIVDASVSSSCTAISSTASSRAHPGSRVSAMQCMMRVSC